MPDFLRNNLRIDSQIYNIEEVEVALNNRQIGL